MVMVMVMVMLMVTPSFPIRTTAAAEVQEVASNLFYLGRAGIKTVGKLTVAFLSSKHRGDGAPHPHGWLATIAVFDRYGSKSSNVVAVLSVSGMQLAKHCSRRKDGRCLRCYSV